MKQIVEKRSIGGSQDSSLDLDSRAIRESPLHICLEMVLGIDRLGIY